VASTRPGPRSDGRFAAIGRRPPGGVGSDGELLAHGRVAPAPAQAFVDRLQRLPPDFAAQRVAERPQRIVPRYQARAGGRLDAPWSAACGPGGRGVVAAWAIRCARR
jgi:hypothetical protein